MSAGRYTLIEDYQINYAGGSCYLCKSNKRADEPIVDCHIEIEGEGFLAICGSCAKEIGALVGMVEEGNLGEALMDLESLERRNTELEDELENRKGLEEKLEASLAMVRGK